MKLETIYDTHRLNNQKLEEFGFHKQKSNYQKRISLKEKNFEAIFLITEKNVKIKVIDKEIEEEYLPFYIEEDAGPFTKEIKHEVNILWQEIINNCFEPLDIKKKILDYIKETYQTIPNYSWEQDKTTCTFKTNINKKWYGIMMEIPYKRLGLEKEGLALIINLKNEPKKVKKLIDNKNYFEAYHMNKKHWYTILLTTQVDISKLKKQIDQSYNLVENKKKS